MKAVGPMAPARGLPATHPLMHRTRSVDYAVVLSGEIDMMLDDTVGAVEARRYRGATGDQSRLGQSRKGDLPDPFRADGFQATLELCRQFWRVLWPRLQIGNVGEFLLFESLGARIFASRSASGPKRLAFGGWRGTGETVLAPADGHCLAASMIPSYRDLLADRISNLLSAPSEQREGSPICATTPDFFSARP